MKKLFLLTIFRAAVLSVFLTGASASSFSNQPVVSAASTSGAAPIRGFQFFSPGAGWVWIGQKLFQTQNGGTDWIEITPPETAGDSLTAVSFLDAQNGWALASGTGGFILDKTEDAGKSWSALALPADSLGLEVQDASIHFVDPQTGWIVFHLTTSSNFDLGVLYRTLDGGQSWEKLSIPSGDPVRFVHPSLGWTAGGAGRSTLSQTQNGGQTWEEIAPDPGEVSYQLPVFAADGPGMLAASRSGQVDLLLTQDGGQTWQVAQTVAAPQLSVTDPVHIPAAAAGGDGFVISIPGDSRIYHLSVSGQLTTVDPQNLSGAVLNLDFISGSEGYALIVPPCMDAEPQSCSAETRLLHTLNGGSTWDNIVLPVVPEQPNASLLSSTAAVTYTQAIDKCDLSSTSSLGVWATSSPYKAVNLYLGGISRATGCPNLNLTASNLLTLNKKGWKFIPTWVGPQAACTVYKYKMDSNSTNASNQGISEANAAADKAISLGIPPGDSRSTIYYDLEAYSTSTCLTTARTAAKWLIYGWTKRLSERGFKSGVYGGTCSSYLTDLSNVTGLPTGAKPPDAVWAAYWNSSSYNSAASVFGIPCLSDVFWAGGQRIHQYAGDHNETWGSVTLAIDSDVYDSQYISTVDGTPPITTVSLQATSGDNNWYISTLQFSFTAVDPLPGVGVKSIQFSLDGGAWQRYASPVTVSSDGVHNLLYQAVDNNDNIEVVKFISFQMDTHPPIGSFALASGLPVTISRWVSVNFSASDAEGGIQYARLRDSGGTWSAWQPYSTSLLWQLPYSFGQQVTVEAQLKDNAGNLSAVLSDSIQLEKGVYLFLPVIRR